MRLTIKILQGEECVVDVEGYEKISKIKDAVYSKLNIPKYCQRLVYNGKTLMDDKTVSESGVRNGGKIHLVIKKETAHKPLIWDELYRVLKKHFKEPDCSVVLEQMKKDFQDNIDNLSLDDIEKIAHSSMPIQTN